METQHLRYLESVAEHGSISAAARALNMNQPTLTKILRRLEEEFAVSFFQRKARGVELTPSGERFLIHARAILGEIRLVNSELENLKTGRRGTIVIGAGQRWLNRLLPTAISKLNELHPDVLITVKTGSRENMLEALQRGDLDIFLGAITTSDYDQFNLVQTIRLTFKVTARINHPLIQNGELFDKKELLNYDWVLPPEADPTVQHLNALFRENRLQPPKTTIEAVSLNFVSHLLRRSNLLGVLPAVEVSGYEAGLASLDLKWLEMERVAGVHTALNRPLSPVSTQFIQLLTECSNGGFSTEQHCMPEQAVGKT